MKARSEGRFSPLQGALYSLIAVGNLYLLVEFYDALSGPPFHAFMLLAGVFSFLLLARHDLMATWHMGRRGSVGTAVLSSWALVLVLLLAFSYLSKSSSYFSRLTIVTWALSTPVLLWGLNLSARFVARRVVPHSLARRKAVLVFANDSARMLAQNLDRSPLYEIAGYFDDRADVRLGESARLATRLGGIADLIPYIRANAVDVVFVMLPEGGIGRVVNVLDELGDTTASVYVVPHFAFYDLLGAELSEVEGVPVLRVAETPMYGADGVFKHVFDVSLAFVGLLLMTPLLLLIALAVKLDSRGPVMYRQRRYGLHGQEFLVYKFRTMTVADRESEIVQVSRDDPRVTRVGRFLRRTSLDELPQLLNVLIGDMSLVGPRPHSVVHNEYYRKSVKRYMVRHKVKPGLTGWAQVHGCRGETAELGRMEDRIRYDLDYIRRWSPWMDIKIILMTLVIILRDRNAY
ncbi:MAG TPA: undecaprenyl-phosphate glucose phosphotransferase [Solimonas sp.]